MGNLIKSLMSKGKVWAFVLAALLGAIYGISLLLGVGFVTDQAKDLLTSVQSEYANIKTPTVVVVTPSQTIVVSETAVVTPTVQ